MFSLQRLTCKENKDQASPQSHAIWGFLITPRLTHKSWLICMQYKMNDILLIWKRRKLRLRQFKECSEKFEVQSFQEKSLKENIYALVFSSKKKKRKRNSCILELYVELIWGWKELIPVKYSEQSLAINFNCFNYYC